MKDREDDLSSYRMTLRKRKGTWKGKH